MPRVGDYSKCKIYKITSLNNPELVYYGHTCQPLSHRFASHKVKDYICTSKIVIEKGDAVILLVEDYPCESKDQAKARETFYILNNHCVNKCIPGQTPRQYRETHSERMKERDKNYYNLNKETMLENRKEYQKQYNESHQKERKEYQRQYYLKKKSEKIII